MVFTDQQNIVLAHYENLIKVSDKRANSTGTAGIFLTLIALTCSAFIFVNGYTVWIIITAFTGAIALLLISMWLYYFTRSKSLKSELTLKREEFIFTNEHPNL